MAAAQKTSAPGAIEHKQIYARDSRRNVKTTNQTSPPSSFKLNAHTGRPKTERSLQDAQPAPRRRAISGQSPAANLAPRFQIEPQPLIEYSNSTGAAVACRAHTIAGAEQSVALTWHRVRQLASADWLLAQQAVSAKHLEGDQPEGELLDEQVAPSQGDPQALVSVRQDGSLLVRPFAAEELQPETVHSATYRCCLGNQFGSLCSRPVRLRAVLDTGECNLEVFDELALAGNSIVLKCRPPSSQVSKYLAPDSFAWFRNDKLLITQQQWQLTLSSSALKNDLFSRPRRLKLIGQDQVKPRTLQDEKFLLFPNGNLLIRNVSKHDAAYYKCRARHQLTRQQWINKNPGQLIVDESGGSSGDQIRPLISEPLIWGRENEQNFLLCAPFHAAPGSTFTWFKLLENPMLATENPAKIPLFSSTTMPTEDQIMQLDSCLLFRQLAQRHAGTYMCEASGGKSNVVGSAKRLVVSSAQLSAQISLTTSNYHQSVSVATNPLKMAPQFPQLPATPTNSVLAYGSSAQINCTIFGQPYDTIAWFKDSHLMGVTSMFNSSTSSSGGGSKWRSSLLQAPSGSLANVKFVHANVISIEGFHLKNSGIYQCQVYSAGGDVATLVGKLIASTMEAQKSLRASSESIRSVQAQVEAQAERDFLRSASASIQLDVAMGGPQLLQHQHQSNKQVISAQKGSPVSLQCAVTGLPAPRVVWFLDNLPIASGAISGVEEPDSSFEDSGDASHHLGGFIADERFQIGSQLHEELSGSSWPVVVSYLNISRADVSESGRYKCVASNILGTSQQLFQLNVIQNSDNSQVQVRSYQRQNVTLVAGSKIATLQCPVIGYPLSRVEWFHSGQRLPSNHRQRIEPIKMGSGGQLELTNVDKQSDSGHYSCRVQLNDSSSDIGSDSTSGDSVTGQIQVNVRVAPLIDTQSLPELVQTSEGLRTKLVCSIAQGDHPIDIRWLRRTSGKGRSVSVGKNLWPGYELMQNSGGDTGKSQEDSIAVLNLDDSCQLTFRQINYADAGDYLCVASNDVSQSVRRTRVVVNVAPAWSQLTDSLVADDSVLLGDRLQLDCQAHGHPSPQVKWRRGSGQEKGSEANSERASGVSPSQAEYSELANNYKNRAFPNGTLIVEQVEEQDAGVYMCEVSNGVGVGLSRVIRVRVNVPPYFKQRASTQLAQANGNVQLKCLVFGDQPMIVGWRKGATEVIDLVKDPRHRVVSEQQLANQLTESILAIDNVTRTDSGQYACIASNEFGTEETRIHLIVQEPPEAPVIMRPIRAGSRQATITFRLPFSGNSPIRKYAIYYKQLFATEYVDLSANLSQSKRDNSLQGWQQVLVDAPKAGEQSDDSGTELTASQVSSSASEALETHQLINLNLCCLKPYARYAVRVRAINEIGQSEPSRPVQLATDEEAIGGPPLDVQVEATGAYSIKVRWRPPAPSLQNGLIKGYYIGYKANPVTGSQQNNPLIVSGSSGKTAALTNVRVFENAFADGEQYQYKNVQLDLSPASSSGPRFSGLMLLSANSDDLQQISDMNSTTGAFGASQQPQVYTSYLTNLRRKTSYSIIVQAYNKVGTGPRSDQIIASTLDAAPPMSPILRLVSVTYDSAQLIKFGRKFGESFGNLSKATNGAYRSDGPDSDRTLADQGELGLDSFSALDEDDDPQSYFTINYKLESPSSQTGSSHQHQQQAQVSVETGDNWQQKKIQKRQPLPYLLTNLRCGSYYLAYMTATNSLGQSEPGETIRFNTMGAAPIAPKESRDFLVLNATYAVLKLNQWHNAGCIIGSFVIRYRSANQVKWSILEHQVHPTIQTVTISGSPVFSISTIGQPIDQRPVGASNQRQITSMLSDFIIRNLQPATTYKLIVEANSEAGTTLAEYDFDTGNFTSFTVSINVNGIVASEIGASSSSSGSNSGELDFSSIGGNQRVTGNPTLLHRYSGPLNMWSLTVVLVLLSIIMGIATLFLGVRSFVRMKHPRGDAALSSLFCCASSSSSASSGGEADSSHSSSGGTCYQLPDHGGSHLGGYGDSIANQANCSLPGGLRSPSLGRKPHLGQRHQRYQVTSKQALEAAAGSVDELAFPMGQQFGRPNQLVTSSSLSTIGGQYAAATLARNQRNAQTLSRFNPSNEPGGCQSDHIRAHYAATLGKQLIDPLNRSPFAGGNPGGPPLKYNMASPVYARSGQQYLSLLSDANNLSNGSPPYHSYQARHQQQVSSSEAGTSEYETNNSTQNEAANKADQQTTELANMYNLHSLDAPIYQTQTTTTACTDGTQASQGNLFSAALQRANQLYQQEFESAGQNQGQCHYGGAAGSSQLPHQVAYGLLFGASHNGGEQVAGNEKISHEQQQVSELELNHQLSSLLANHLQQTPN